MGGPDGDEVDPAWSSTNWRPQSDELRWAISSTAPGGRHPATAPGSPDPAEGRGLGTGPIDRLLPGEAARGWYRADQVDAAAVARPARPDADRPHERRALALFVGTGSVLLTSHRILVLLSAGQSLQGDFGPSTETELTASLPLEHVSRLVLGSTADDAATTARHEPLWILIETVRATMVSLELPRTRTDEDESDRNESDRDRSTFRQFVTTTVDRLRSTPRVDTPRPVLDRAADGPWERDGDDLVVTLTDRPLDTSGP